MAMAANTLSVMGSANTSVPHTTAVTGSRAPRIEVAVEPMQRTDITSDVHDTTVGTIASSSTSPHASAEGTGCSRVPKPVRAKKMAVPAANDQKATFEPRRWRTRDLLTMMMYAA